MAFAPPRRDKEPVHTTAEIAIPLLEEIRGVFKGDPYEFLDGTIGNLLGISRGTFLISIYIGLLGVLWYQIPNLPTFALAWIVGMMPIWLLPVAVTTGWKAWRWYVQSNFLASKKGVLLEVKMPRELVKSPRGMDVALSQLWMNMGEVTFMNRSWNGSVRPMFSFELVSLGGQVHYYMWCWASHRHVLESIIYAQYPEVEIVEAEDYATKFQYDPEKNFAACLDLRYEPKNDAYTIKTYVDFELDKDPKEEYKVDPLAQVLESLSSLKPHEQAWIAIIITMQKENRRKPHGKWWETESRWKGLLLEEIDHIRHDSLGGDIDAPGERWRSFVRIQQFRQTETIRSIDRNLSKHPYNVGIHMTYITEPADKFDYPTFVRMREIFHPFGNPGWGNYLRYRRWHVPFDYPYQDLWDLRWQLHTRRFMDCYRRRAHFYAPYQLPYNMMSTEVIASLWHPATSGIKAPGIERIPSKKAEPPPNLPK